MEELTAGSDEKHCAAPPGFEPGFSNYQVDRLTTELRSQGRNRVQIIAFHVFFSSDPALNSSMRKGENSVPWGSFLFCEQSF